VDEALMERTLQRLLSLDQVTDEQGEKRPWVIPFTEDARRLMDDFRLAVRGWEAGAEGLSLSFIGNRRWKTRPSWSSPIAMTWMISSSRPSPCAAT